MSAAREPEYRDGHGFIAEVIRTRRRKYLERVKKSAWAYSYEDRQSGVRDAKKLQIPTFNRD